MLAALLVASVAAVPVRAQQASNPVVAERMRLMSDIGAASKIMGDMVSGRSAFDAARAAQAASTLAQLSSRVPDAFTANETDPASEALPSIWANWSTFTARADAMRTAAQNIDTSSEGGLRAGLAELGGACRACHTTFRE
ncbi:Cytochrome c556 [Roseicitreum antarcticum]|uniref:Cytochrome c556 n=2 Tax=Roseicitreum antarcticum TaxID=564137 RepID=A0A1H2VNN0_9RHOB|nr:Cytochrome c556 [Roseicitreum antarcticum]